MPGEARKRATARHREVQCGAQIHSACTCVQRRRRRAFSRFVRLNARFFSRLSPKVGAIDPAQSHRLQHCASFCTTWQVSTSRRVRRAVPTHSGARTAWFGVPRQPVALRILEYQTRKSSHASRVLCSNFPTARTSVSTPIRAKPLSSIVTCSYQCCTAFDSMLESRHHPDRQSVF